MGYSHWKSTSQGHTDMVWAGIKILATAFFGALFIGICLAVPYVLGALFPPPVVG